MNNIELHENIKNIAIIYGYDKQSRQLIEEMAELTQAINKFWRKQLLCGEKTIENTPINNQEKLNIIEEIGDVEICLEQVKYLLKVSKSGLTESKKLKVERELKRIEESGAHNGK